MRGRLANAIVLITADHGEELFEHGQPLHLQHYTECVQVPFLLRAPNSLVGPLANGGPQVSLVDVVPTILELAGVETPPTQGRSLAPLVRGEDVELDARVLLVSRELELGARTRTWSVVPRKGRAPGWFELATDPGETRDLGEGADPDSAEPAWREEAAAWLAEEAQRNELLRRHFGAGEAVELTEAERDALSALGYGGDEAD